MVRYEKIVDYVPFALCDCASSGASHTGLSLDRCSPFFAVSYHGNIDTDFNETHPGVKCDWDENKTISVIRNYV